MVTLLKVALCVVCTRERCYGRVGFRLPIYIRICTQCNHSGLQYRDCSLTLGSVVMDSWVTVDLDRGRGREGRGREGRGGEGRGGEERGGEGRGGEGRGRVLVYHALPTIYHIPRQ